ncbi:MAG: exonuclease, partial [Thermomicrobiales bacterium]|nr:exonuclease [Thermomicrobiales bacterium]
AAEGVRLAEQPVDVATLGAVLIPGLPAPDVPSLRESLGLPEAAQDEAQHIADIYEALLVRVAEYDDLTLERIHHHAVEAEWPHAALFEVTRSARLRSEIPVPRLDPPELQFLRDRPREEELEPTGSLAEVADEAVRGVLGPGGALAGVIAGFEQRVQQEQMAEAVAHAINESGQLLVEAGTGTGKSLAYLVPAALSAAERGQTAVLSTNTLALQDQLLRKDVPDLTAALAKAETGTPVGVVAVKGRANYLCLRRWLVWERQPSLDVDEASLKAKILAWLPRTQTGDRAELRLTAGEERFWRQVAEEEGSCDPGSCVFHHRGQCFLFRARRAAEAAHLVVVNHALLLTDAASSNRILPPFDTLIVDEAHHLEDQATTQFTVSLQERDLAEYADALAVSDGAVVSGVAAGAMGFLLGAVEDGAGQKRARDARQHVDAALDVAARLRSAGREVFAALETVHLESGEFSGGERTRRVTAATRSVESWEAVEQGWDRLLGAMKDAEKELRWFLNAVDAVDDVAVADLAEAGERQELLLGDLQSTIRFGSELAAKYASAFDTPAGDRVYWLERVGAADRLVFRSAPLDVSGLLQEKLFKRPRTTVLTSATLAIDGSCGYVARRLGLPDAQSLIVPSPFDYRRSVLLYLADDIPDPTSPAYREVLEQTLIESIGATQGKALVLFTSHALLADMARAISGPLLERGVVVLAQRRDGSPQQLTERLRRERNVAVLGTSSFWEGVDVAGEALSLLMITRLPFSVPTDPVFAARSEAFDDAFAGYAVPQAVLRFKQGFGRLIRSSSDRGVCAVLDRRILTRRYGATFLQSLPECTVEVGSARDLPRAAREWLPTGEGPAAVSQPLLIREEG